MPAEPSEAASAPPSRAGSAQADAATFSVHVDPDELEAQRLAAAVHGSEETTRSARRAAKPAAAASSGRGKVAVPDQGTHQQRRYAFRRS